MLDMIIIDGLSFALPLFIMAIGGITSLTLESFGVCGAFGSSSTVLDSKGRKQMLDTIFASSRRHIEPEIAGFAFAACSAVLDRKGRK